MSLLRFEAARPWARAIARQVVAGSMPPWHAAPEHGEFANERRLSDRERDRLLEWVAAGAPAGDPAAGAEPPAFVTGWSIAGDGRTPDLVLELPAVEVPATGDPPYHDLVVDPGFEEDLWVRAAQVLPGNRDVVHHVIVDSVIDDPLLRRRLAREGYDSRVQGSLGGYVPGDEPLVLPPGLARRVPAGARLYIQIHYTPTGRPERDQSRLGLVLADGPPRREVRTGIASNPFIHIPAGSTGTSLEASFVFRRDSVLLALRPHLHRRGDTFEYRARYPDGREEILLRVEEYDFDWQTRYVLAEPKRMPAGTELSCTATWDNSAGNPDNPDPTATVTWGPRTEDEMMIGFLDYYEEPSAGDAGRDGAPR